MAVTASQRKGLLSGACWALAGAAAAFMGGPLLLERRFHEEPFPLWSISGESERRGNTFYGAAPTALDILLLSFPSAHALGYLRDAPTALGFGARSSISSL